MDSLKILRATIRLLVNESMKEGSLDAAWSLSPLATTGAEDEDDESVSESDEDIEEFGGGYGRPCGC